MQICENITDTKRLKRFETLEAELNEKHNFKYDYSKSIFTGFSNKIEIICVKHGSFLQRFNNHKSGQGCPACAKEKLKEPKSQEHKDKIRNSHYGINPSEETLLKLKRPKSEEQKKKQTLTQEEVITQFVAVHGDNYDYSLVSYIKNTVKVDIVCLIHGIFKQTPKQHKRGAGCPRCKIEKLINITAEQKYKNNRTSLYYIRINSDFYKIGLTRTSIENRFKKENINIEIIKEWIFNDGMEAYNIEQQILREVNFAYVSRINSPISCGYTELRDFNFIDIVENIIKFNIKEIK